MKKEKKLTEKQVAAKAEAIALERRKLKVSTANVASFNASAGMMYEPVPLRTAISGPKSCQAFLDALFAPEDTIVWSYDLFNHRTSPVAGFKPPHRISRRGAYVKVNASRVERPSGHGGGYRDKDCGFRNVMLELDKCPVDQQRVLWPLLISMGLPVVSLTDSRGKSLHAVLRLSCGEGRYKETAGALAALLMPFLPDYTSVNQSRYTRFPSFVRAEKGADAVQNLLYLNPDAPEWTPESPCNGLIRDLCAGLEAPPESVRSYLDRMKVRTDRVETEESAKESREFNAWVRGLPLEGGLDMEHLVSATGLKTCPLEEDKTNRKYFITCPWCEEHGGGGDDDGAKDAYIFERKTAARFRWGFHCAHASCTESGRGIKDVFELLMEDYRTEFDDSIIPHPDVAELLDEEPEEVLPAPVTAAEPASPAPPAPPEPETIEGTGDLLAMVSSEFADSALFQKFHGKRVRYLHDEEQWLIWQKGVWGRDTSEKIRELAKDVSRKRMERSKDPDEQAAIARAATSKMIDGILKTSRSVKGIAATSSQFDSNPWLLGCQNGVLNLQTGEFSLGNPHDCVSLRCGVSYRPDAACPRFRAFIDEVFPGRPGVAAFLKRWSGYSLTGLSSEQRVLILYGHGSNGKSTLLDAIRAVMGEYAINSPKSLLIGNPRGDDPSAATPSLADLKGKRASFVSETEADARLSESKVKDLTSGEEIMARQPHGGYFSLRANAKVVLSSNHEPRVPGTDTGIWRRLLKVEFLENFSGREDGALAEILESEREGILNWLLEGCREWQEMGLGVPEEVLSATQAMRESMDVQGQFLEQCCTQKEGERVLLKDLYSRYRMWASEQGTGAWSSITFNRKMKDRKFATARIDGYDLWKGLSLNSDVPA